MIQRAFTTTRVRPFLMALPIALIILAAMASGALAAEKVGFCSVSQNLGCATNADCPASETCTLLATPPSGGATLENQLCMQDVAGFGLQCTANDVQLAGVTDVNILDDGCAFPGDTVTFSFISKVLLTAQDRYDVGIWFAEDGGNALTGQCAIVTLPNSPTPPFVNLDAVNQPNDTCGDITNDHNPIFTEVQQITVTCEDTSVPKDGLLEVAVCTSWRQPGANDLCTSPLDAFPGAPSKCLCVPGFTFPINVPLDGYIEVIKNLDPTTDSGLFNLYVDQGETYEQGITDQTHLGTTGKLKVSAGHLLDPAPGGADHTVGETAGTGTSLGDYTSSISCVARGTTAPVLYSASGSGPLTVRVMPSGPSNDIVCTITNTRKQGTIIVKKIAVSKAGVDYCPPNRGFGFSLDTTPNPTTFVLQSNVCDPSSSVLPYLATYTVAPGTYTIAETDSDINVPPNGWTLLNTTACTRTSTGDPWVVDLQNKNVTGSVVNGETIECTFRNKQDSDLAVTLESLAAQATGTTVNVAWQTVSDISTRGFNLHRAASEAGPWTRLNSALIPVVALGSTSGNAYAWTDTTAAPGGTYWYRLDDVSLSGAVTSHPAVMVVVDAPTSVGLVGLGATPALGTAMPLAVIGISLLTGFAVARRRRR